VPLGSKIRSDLPCLLPIPRWKSQLLVIRRSAGASDGYIPYVGMDMRYLASNESYNGTYEGRMIPSTYDRHVTDVQDYTSNEYICTRGTRLSESSMEIFRI